MAAKPRKTVLCKWWAALALLLSSGPGLAESGAEPVRWESAGGYRWREVLVPPQGRTGFTLMPPESTGVGFTNHLSETASALNRILENGSGVALGDVDGDGWCDIYFCRLEGDNVMYRNLGNWRFEDISSAAGVACPGQRSTGAVFTDVDGDGDLDLLVNSLGGGTRCFLNDGKGRFAERTDAGLVREFGSTSMALADIDGDGDLDLYVANYRTTTYKDRPPGLNVTARRVDGRIVVSPEDRFVPLAPRAGGVEVLELGEADILYINDGQGRFASVSWTDGTFSTETGEPLSAPKRDWALSVAFRDLNGDCWPDIYVCNDFFMSPDRVWINDRSGRFRAMPAFALRNMSLSAMGADFADINRDGFDDFFVADMVSRNHSWRQRQRPDVMKGLMRPPFENPGFRPEVVRNTLCLNRGDGTYAEIAQLAGVDATEWSWGAVFLDADLDGYEDLLIPTGNNHDVQDADVLREQRRVRQVDSLEVRVRNWRQFPALATPILAYRNNRDLTFSETTAAWGFGEPGPFQGMAVADLDNDGDLDLVANRLNACAGLYRNESAAPRLAVRLKGAGKNTRGIGARIRVLGGPAPQSQEMQCGGRYLSCDDSARVFAAGAATNRLTVEVTWRSGKRSVLDGLPPNRVYELDEAAADKTALPRPEPPARLFRDVSAQLAHSHVDEPFDDYERQPLLSRKLSRLGPGVAWWDWDGDGWDDLFIGSGKGGVPAIYLNDRRGGFSIAPGGFGNPPLGRDVTGVAGLRSASGKPALLIGVSSYEDGAANTPGVLRLEQGASVSVDCVPGAESSVGPLALADVDGDGDLDLFVGGRVVPGHYPAAAVSRLFMNQADGYRLDETASRVLSKVGMVSGAVFSDLNGDGRADLVVACEWGPIRVFINVGAGLREATRELGFESFTGWWNGVTAGDFDGDGRMDLAASNWGRNTRFQRHLDKPLRVHYGDIAGLLMGDVVETYFDRVLGKWVPWRDYDTMARAFPFMAPAIPTFKAYGNAGIEDVLGERLSAARVLEVRTLDSMVFLNRGDRFEARALPAEAQFAPAFGLAVADFDGDGAEDLFLSQNFFDVEEETSRYDAGLGLLLRGDGRGEFKALAARESGIRVFGEQRGCAAADYDGDGRVDLVVAQNSGETKLYRNDRARPGVRVRLEGPPGNADGIGTILQLRTGGQLGPAREVHSGSGYWSQDSVVQVLGGAKDASQLWVRWPGGKTATVEIPQGAREVSVRF